MMEYSPDMLESLARRHGSGLLGLHAGQVARLGRQITADRVAALAAFRASLRRSSPAAAGAREATSAAPAAYTPTPGYEGMTGRYSGPLRIFERTPDRWAARELVRDMARQAEAANPWGPKPLAEAEPDMHALGVRLGRRHGSNPRDAAISAGYRVIIGAPASLRATFDVGPETDACFARAVGALVVFEGANPSQADALLAHELGHALDDVRRPAGSEAWSWASWSERRAQAFALGFVVG